MRLLGARVALIGASTLAVGVALAGARWPIADTVNRPSMQRSARNTSSPVRVADSILQRVIAQAPFRAMRRLAAVAYDPVRSTESAPIAVPAPPKPALALSGIVWGSEPAAVIEGLPGVEGPRVMRRGDVVSELTVKRIERSRVVITGLDTTWNLSLRTSWQ